MANQTITPTSITVHGRGSLVLPYEVRAYASNDQIDISEWPLVFEVDGVPITTPLIANPADAKGLLIQLTRTQIASLKKGGTRFSVIDTSRADDDIYNVLWSGTINRDGYVGSPDMVDDD